jgi:hypothetical protein
MVASDRLLIVTASVTREAVSESFVTPLRRDIEPRSDIPSTWAMREDFVTANFREHIGGEVRRMEILRRNCLRMNKVSDLQDARYEVSRVVWNHTNDTPEVMQPVS